MQSQGDLADGLAVHCEVEIENQVGQRLTKTTWELGR